MGINKNQINNTNKPENSQKQDSIIKKIGKKENYYVNESTNKYINKGDEIVMSKFVYSGRAPKPDIIGEILKRLEKIDSKLDAQREEIGKINVKIDNIDERITNIEQVQKLQREEIKEINIKIDNIDGRLIKLENKVDNVITLNNLRIE